MSAREQPHPMTPKATPLPQRPRLFGAVIALMYALAGGAVWCLLSLYRRGDLAAFAFVVAIVVVWQLRANGYAGRWVGALIGAVCVLIAAAYAFYLQAIAQVASMLGLPMRNALMQIEPSMAADIARANLGGWSSTIVIAAALLAAVAMLRERKS
jgi:glucan phosphoethanolaminetransferase (alkaline phosphatase superfamily)